MTKKEQITLNMRYSEIKIIKYSQFDLEKEFEKSEKPLTEFQSHFQFKVLDKEEIVACLVTVKIVIIQTKEQFAEIQIENLFEINPLKDLIKEVEPGKYTIPDEIIINLASLSASTVRGILSEKLKGTIAQKEVYPLIDPASFLLNK